MRNRSTPFLITALLLTAATPLAAQQSKTKKAETEGENVKGEAGDTAKNIATKPLKDLNIIKKEIPAELAAMVDDPYSLRGLRNCPQFKREIVKITKIVGPDVDSAEARNKKGQKPAEFTFGLIESAAGSLVPFSGVIRRISGAQSHDRKVATALFAGSVRRAYLKGIARTKGCRL